MFFELTNSSAIFQTTINKILWNLINIRKVVSFTDDVIMETEEKERHDEVVKKVVKRLAENDLYVKPEKCKWKVREIGFLGVMIKLEGIKIEEEKVKRVLEQLTLKEVKDIQKFLEWPTIISSSQIITQYGKEKSEVGLNRKTRESILGVKEEVYKRIVPDLDKKNKDRS